MPDTRGSFPDAWIVSTSDESDADLMLVCGNCWTMVDPLAIKSVVTKQRLNKENLAVRAMIDRATIFKF
jgi:hypothetical protein